MAVFPELSGRPSRFPSPLDGERKLAWRPSRPGVTLPDMSQITRSHLNAVGSTEGVSRYLERIKMFPSASAAEEEMGALRPRWLASIDVCSASSGMPLSEIEPYWPRTFQVYHENRLPGRAGWDTDLTEERGMWITAALIREPEMRFTAEYLSYVGGIVDAASRNTPPLLTYRAAARLLLNAAVWGRIEHMRERPYEIAELLKLTESDLRAEHFRRNRRHVKRLPQKSGVVYPDKLYEMLVRVINERLS